MPPAVVDGGSCFFGNVVRNIDNDRHLIVAVVDEMEEEIMPAIVIREHPGARSHRRRRRRHRQCRRWRRHESHGSEQARLRGIARIRVRSERIEYGQHIIFETSRPTGEW